MRNPAKLIALALSTLILPASAESRDSAPIRRQPAVAVWTYGSPTSCGGSDYGPTALSRAMIAEVKARLASSRRFELSSTDDVPATGDRVFGRPPRTPEEAVEVGRELGLDFLIYGNVERAWTDVDRCETETGKGRNRHCEVTYNAKTELTVHHVAVDVQSGRVWRDWRDKDCRAWTSSCYPDRSDFRSSFLRSVNSTAAAWVRQIVPDRRGRIVSRGEGVVVIDLGRRDGVGMDTDFTFKQPDVLRDAAGNPLRDPDGRTFPNESAVRAAPSGEHDPGPIFGRPVTVQDDYCVVKVGYRGSGGFLGLETKFRENAKCLEALRVGDDAVLREHVGK